MELLLNTGYYKTNKMSVYNRSSSIVQQEKEKIILFSDINPTSTVDWKYTGIYKLDNNYDYDSSFNTVDSITNTTFNNTVRDVSVDSNGGIYVGGAFTTYRNVSANRIIKLLPSGDKDTTFNNTTGFNNLCLKVYVDENDKIYCFGSFTTYKGVTANRLIRLNPDGTKDTGFDNSTGFNSTVFNVTVDSSGKIYCVGQFTTYKGVVVNRIVRLNTDGSLDTSFSVGVGFDNTPRYIVLDSSEKVIVLGQFTTYSGVSANGIVKLNTDGSIDNSFNYGTGFSPIPTSLKSLQIDELNNIYISNGASITYNGSLESNALWKIGSDGSFIDNLNYPSGIDGGLLKVINSDNIILTKDLTISLYDSNYNIKKTILIKPSFSAPENLFQDLSGNTFLYTFRDNGIFNKSYGHGTPLGENGLLKKEKFNQNFGINSSIPDSVLLTKNNKLLFLDNGVISYNNKEKNDILKLTLNGSLDNEFDTGTGFNSSIGYLIDDYLGNIYCITTSTEYKGVTLPTNSKILKIKKNGDLDETFSQILFDSNVGAIIEVQKDNKLFCVVNAGDSFTLSGKTYNGLIRFNVDGSIDDTFSGKTWSSSPQINNIYLDNNDKIYLYSPIQPLTYDGISVGSIIKLNSDGSLDTGFNSGSINSTVYTMLVDNYGKLLIGGSFTSYSGVTNNRILRLNSDGNIDSSFDNTTGFNSTVYNLNYDYDTDKIYCSGTFATYKGQSYRYMIGLNYDGTINTGFYVSPNSNYGGNDRKIFIVNN